MENKSEYGIYEEFLKNFDSVNYKNKDSSIINNEFQKVISELCEKDMINVALQAELDRQVFLIRKSFEFQDDETKGTIKGLSCLFWLIPYQILHFRTVSAILRY